MKRVKVFKVVKLRDGVWAIKNTYNDMIMAEYNDSVTGKMEATRKCKTLNSIFADEIERVS